MCAWKGDICPQMSGLKIWSTSHKSDSSRKLVTNSSLYSNLANPVLVLEKLKVSLPEYGQPFLRLPPYISTVFFMTWIVFSSALNIATRIYGYQSGTQLQSVKKKSHYGKSCAVLWAPNLLSIILKLKNTAMRLWSDDPLGPSPLAWYTQWFSVSATPVVLRVGGTKALASALFSPSWRSWMFMSPYEKKDDTYSLHIEAS